MIVELDPGEYAVAHMVATMRRTVNLSAHVRDQRRDSKMAAIDLDLIGAIAEVAWGKWKNCFPDLTISPRAGSADAVVGGLRVDIKATTRNDGRLLATTGKKEGAAEVYVLAVVDGARVEFKGYALSEDLLSESTLTDLGHGPTHALPQSELRKFREDQ